jgi:hypothetical protein
MRIALCLIAVWLLAWPATVQAQFDYITNADNTITITSYNGDGGDVVIPGTINDYPVTAIGYIAFYYQTAITSVTIPNSVTSIGEGAFFGCSLITNVMIGKSVTNIGGHAFYGCSALISVMIPNSVTTIGDNAFMQSGLMTVTIPNSISNIGTAVFAYCISLESVIISDGVTNIGDGTFSGCRSLTSVAIPCSITKLGSHVFDDCHALKSMTIPNSVTSIGNGAFRFCYGLTNMTIPNSVTNIGFLAFEYCYSLHQLYFQGNAPSVNGKLGSMDSSIFDGEDGTVSYLPSTIGWGSTFGGWPTAIWQPQLQSAGNVDYSTNGFVININWASGQTVVVEASTNLQNWTPVITNSLVNGTYDFSDSTWTNYPQQFYRVRSQ